jgi:group I intron endonuclease
MISAHGGALMKNSISGIYQIRNTVNGHCYVGSAINIHKRWGEHKRALKQNKHYNFHLQSAWNKYGADSFKFSILETCFSFVLIFREQHYMNLLKPAYNLSPAAGSPLGIKRSPEHCKKNSEARKGNKNLLGYRHTAETKAKMAENRILSLGAFSPEARAKISAAQKGKPKSAETKAKISAAMKGKVGHKGWRKGRKHTTETKAKMSIAKKLMWVNKKQKP